MRLTLFCLTTLFGAKVVKPESAVDAFRAHIARQTDGRLRFEDKIIVEDAKAAMTRLEAALKIADNEFQDESAAVNAIIGLARDHADDKKAATKVAESLDNIAGLSGNGKAVYVINMAGQFAREGSEFETMLADKWAQISPTSSVLAVAAPRSGSATAFKPAASVPG